MINGAHAIIYSKAPEADRAFLRDILKLPNVDVGEGWLIFGLPPAEVAVHPSDDNDVQELYLMCADVEAFMAAMKKNHILCAEVSDQGYGLVTRITLPGGGHLGVYQPRHARPNAVGVSASMVSASESGAKTDASKKSVPQPKSRGNQASKKSVPQPKGRGTHARPQPQDRSTQARPKPVSAGKSKKKSAKPAKNKSENKRRGKARKKVKRKR